jgi:hypothetical protein
MEINFWWPHHSIEDDVFCCVSALGQSGVHSDDRPDLIVDGCALISGDDLNFEAVGSAAISIYLIPNGYVLSLRSVPFVIYGFVIVCILLYKFFR